MGAARIGGGAWRRAAVASLLLVLLCLCGGRGPVRAAPSLATGTPAGTTAAQPAAPCPVHPDACTAVARLAEAFLAGDFDAVEDLLFLREYVCPEPRGLGGPSPLCRDAVVGER